MVVPLLHFKRDQKTLIYSDVTGSERLTKMADKTEMNRDPRFDRAVSWFLSAAATVALMVGAWFFSSLNEGLVELRKDISVLTAKIAVLELDRAEIIDLREKVDKIREEQLKRTEAVYKVNSLMTLVNRLSSDLEKAEDRIKELEDGRN